MHSHRTKLTPASKHHSSQSRTHSKLAPRNNLRLRLAIFGALLASTNVVFGIPILTEIHYNGLASGNDPDEFIELSNPGSQTLSLEGWQFTQGIDYLFQDGATLAAGASLVIARDRQAFLGIYTDFQSEVLDFSGALSNSGETLTLSDAAGQEVWSVSYDDNLPWPQEADGLGSSLQLATGVIDTSAVGNWEAAKPTPGAWGASTPTPTPIPAPTSIALLAAGALMLGARKTTRQRLAS